MQSCVEMRVPANLDLIGYPGKEAEGHADGYLTIRSFAMPVKGVAA